MKRWFYTIAINHSFSVSIFETAHYGPTQGYATKEKAIHAAIDDFASKINQTTSLLSSESRKLTNFLTEQDKLRKLLNDNI